MCVRAWGRGEALLDEWSICAARNGLLTADLLGVRFWASGFRL